MIVPGVCASLCAGAVIEKGAFLLERKKRSGSKSNWKWENGKEIYCYYSLIVA